MKRSISHSILYLLLVLPLTAHGEFFKQNNDGATPHQCHQWRTRFGECSPTQFTSGVVKLTCQPIAGHLQTTISECEEYGPGSGPMLPSCNNVCSDAEDKEGDLCICTSGESYPNVGQVCNKETGRCEEDDAPNA